MDNTQKTARRLSDRYRGRIGQLPIYLGKFFRMFVYQNDWMVIPVAAFISALVAFVIRKKFGLTMEDTAKGALAITCVALWNGFFNSIQVVCRERNIVKREHRSGMHISSYIVSHMIYQMFLCVLQTVTSIATFFYLGVHFNTRGLVTGNYMADFFITIFLITYAADMLSLFISSVVRTTTAAMTVMPLVLMVQLIFSGGLFSIPGGAKDLCNLMISYHGMCAICAEADFNQLPSDSGWKMIKKMANGDDADPQLKASIKLMEEDGTADRIKVESAKSNFKEKYVSTTENVKIRWMVMVGFSLFGAIASIIILERIDKDKR